MESLDTTILNTAVPAISAALHVGLLSMKAVLASYTLSLYCVHPDQRLGLLPDSARAGYSQLQSDSLPWGHYYAAYRAISVYS